MRKRLLAWSLVLMSGTLFAQHDHPHNQPCGFDLWHHHIKNTDPERARQMQLAFDQWIEQSKLHVQTRDEEVYQIPVVFHVVWKEAAQNLADSVIFSQLEVLNEDYRRLNANASETRDEFLPVAADTGIEFVLAEFDPEGNPTDGIVRVETDRDGFALDLFGSANSLDEVKSSATGGSDAWNTDQYLNIWICNIEASILGQIFGLAYPPAGVPNWPDGSAAPSDDVSGVIVHYTTVGRNNPSADDDGVDGNDQGRTMVHEVGHYLGLRHIWGDAIAFLGEDGCAVDDGFEDTPNCAAADNFQCNLNANSCSNETVDLPDMIENYMDYSPDACMNMFSQEQADMMRFALINLRPGLINSPALSVNETPALQSVNVFPNPAGNQVSVATDENLNLTRVQVLDQLGRVIKEAEGQGSSLLVLPVENLRQGTYFLRIYSENDFTVRSFIKL